MQTEKLAECSVVYGYIKDMTDNPVQEKGVNQQAVGSLPPMETWPVLCREMFAAFNDSDEVTHISFRSDVMHFGASYDGVEYEWDLWLNQFEALLKKMYWTSVVVHLETEFSGKHTFIWQAQHGRHCPGDPVDQLRGEWNLD